VRARERGERETKGYEPFDLATPCIAQPSARSRACAPHGACVREREFFIDNLLVRIHFIIVMIWWTGLAPWEFDGARDRLRATHPGADPFRGR